MDTKKLRQKILDLAIHGKLVPQDPNDEPASVLLERIRKEKEQLIKEGKIKAPKKSKSAGDTSHYPKEVPFEVPEGWEWIPLGEIIELLSGTSYEKSDIVSSGDGIRILRGGNVQEGNIILKEDDVYVAVTLMNKNARINNGDIVIVGSTGSIDLIGKAALVTQQYCNTQIGAFLRIIRPIDYDFSGYLGIIFQSSLYKKHIRDLAKGTNINNIKSSYLTDFFVPIPPISEQKRIVDTALKYLAFCHELELCGKQISVEIQDVKTRILELAIHGKLVSQDPSDEPAIELLKRINPEFVPSDNLHYVECPSGWAVAQMESIIDLISGRDLENSRCNTEGHGVPYLIGASCIDNSLINIYRWTDTPEVISKEGDVLLSCKGTVGEVVLNTMGNLHIARQFMAIRSKAPQYILPDYLGIIIKASIETLKKAARGVIPGISREDILGLTVMIPPSEEQQRILSRLAEFNQSVSLIVANTCN